MLEHAPAGGEEALNHRFYKGGEFLPFYVPRIDMPQLGPHDWPKLLRYLLKLGVGCQFDHVEPDRLHPHQRINLKRVHDMPEWALNSPCLVSEDGFIIDGHHRWFAHKQLKTLVPVVRINVPFRQAVEILNAWPRATHEAL